MISRIMEILDKEYFDFLDYARFVEPQIVITNQDFLAIFPEAFRPDEKGRVVVIDSHNEWEDKLKQLEDNFFIRFKKLPSFLEEFSRRNFGKNCTNPIQKHLFRLKGQQVLAKTWKTPIGQITNSDIENAKNVPLENLVNVKLRRSAGNFVGCCPFHSERTPSFTIFTQNNHFYCFGCNEQGDTIDFVQKTNNLSFRDAVKFLIY